jgi:hypothetical protein
MKAAHPAAMNNARIDDPLEFRAKSALVTTIAAVPERPLNLRQSDRHE